MAVNNLTAASGPSRRIRIPSIGMMGQKILINVAIIGTIWIVLALLNPRFLTVENLTNVFRQIATLATVGSVVTLLMVSKNFDLSVGGIVALSGCVAATFATSGWPILPAFAAGVLTGTLIGAANGLLVVVVGINSVIATLGTMYLARGSALLVTGGLPVYTVPEGYNLVGAGYVGPVPIPVIIMVTALLVMTLVERRSLLGKYARATGSNPQSARLSGVPVRRVQFVLFALVGAMAGWGGIMISSRANAGLPAVGQGLEFEIIVAAVLGGTSLAGGEGIVFGTFLGALLVGTLNNGLNLLGVPTFWQTVALGVVLVLAVLLDTLMRRRQPQHAGLLRPAPEDLPGQAGQSGVDEA